MNKFGNNLTGLCLLFSLAITPIKVQGERLTGPLLKGLEEPLLVIYGKADSWNEEEDIRGVAKRFQELWGEKNYKSEEKLTPEDMKNDNLLLLCLFSRSKFLEKIRQNLPIDIGDDYIGVGNQRYKSEKGVGVVCLLPNPLNPAKYLTLVGANNSEALKRAPEFWDHFTDPVDYFIYIINEEGYPLKVAGGVFNKDTPLDWRAYPSSIPIDKTYRPFPEEGAIGWFQFDVMRCFPQDAVIIYGTKGSARENKYNKAQAFILQKEWGEWRLPETYPWLTFVGVKSSEEVGEEELKNKNLILIGTINSNPVLSSLKDALPFELGEGFIKANSLHREENIGVIMVFPNPLNPAKYVLVYSGTTFRGICCYSYAWVDDYDYVIFLNPPPFTYTKRGVLEAGRFDRTNPKRWRLDMLRNNFK